MNGSISSRLIGQVLNGTYLITGVIGKGGMGTVYEAAHVRLGDRKYALKVLHASLADNPTIRARFRREAEIATALNHPNIVGITDVNMTEDGQPYLVMELLRGENLEERLKRCARIEIGELTEIVVQVADALHAVHERHIVHRDLKPANIFLVEGPETFVKVLDFGLSKMQLRASVVTQAQTIFGTPFYMSPEQAAGDVEKIDHRSDIFSLGSICYEALSGSVPFAGQSMLDVVIMVATKDFVPLSQRAPDLPAGIDAIFARAMAKDRAARYEDATEFAADLCRLAGVSPPFSPSFREGLLSVRETLRMSAVSRAEQNFPLAYAPTTESTPQMRGEATEFPEASATAVGLPPLPTDALVPSVPEIEAADVEDRLLLNRAEDGPTHEFVTPEATLNVRRRARWGWLLVAVFTPLIAAGVTVAVLRGRTAAVSSAVPLAKPQLPSKAAPAPRPVAQARLTLHVDPPQSQIFLDNVLQTEKPFALSPSPPKHHVHIVAPGYASADLVVPSRVSQELSVTLVPLPQPAATQTVARKERPQRPHATHVAKKKAPTDDALWQLPPPQPPTPKKKRRPLFNEL